MQEIYADILKEKTGIIVHGVNCKGKMGKGIALQIKNTYPKSYEDYVQFCHKNKYSSSMLGDVVFTRINKDLIIASAFTQEFYGMHGYRYASYDAIDAAFCKINGMALQENLIVKFPMIAVGLGGANWSIVSAIIEANRSEGVRHILFKQ